MHAAGVGFRRGVLEPGDECPRNFPRMSDGAFQRRPLQRGQM